MNITLNPETQKLLEEHMRRGKFASPDEAVRSALQTVNEIEGESIEELDTETQAALDRAFAQSAAGQGRPWEDVRAELEAKYLSRK